MRKFFSLLSAHAFVGAATVLLALATGCNYAHGPDPVPTPAPCSDPATATYAAAISPIFDAHCRKCHGSAVYQTMGGGNDYSNYQGIKKQSASLILHCINHDPGFDPMPKGGDKISDCEIARIQAWITAGQLNN